jgi:hypothetical protein
MTSVSRRDRRASLVGMIVGGFLAATPLLGPLGYTVHYLDDFFAQRPQSMRGPDISFYGELLALIICPIGLLIFAISLVFYLKKLKVTTNDK